uniref:Cyclin, N-terminal domain containing protein n=1 Tax=Babesia bovis TaxID=5865 RepID=S6BET9_BABBO|nr:cyclin, N-terminal domain containing protein [Babesia bovis]
MEIIGNNVVAKATDNSFVKSLSNVLLTIVKRNESRKGVVTRFHSMNAPPISISDYINRIARHVRCSNECFVLALVYIERITRIHKNFVVSILNVHRLIITAVMLAAKFSDDVYFSNKFYALVGGVNVTEINLLEYQFLNMLKFQLYVNAMEYENCRLSVEKASYMGSLSANNWGLSWYKPPGACSAEFSDIACSQPTQPSLTSGTHYWDEGDMDLHNGSARAGHYKRLPCTSSYNKGSSFGIPYAVPSVEESCDVYSVGSMAEYGSSMNRFTRQGTNAPTGYRVLSNVHMPQMAPTPRVGNPFVSTPSNDTMHVNNDLSGVYGTHVSSDMYYPLSIYPSPTVNGKHYADGNPVLRNSGAVMNRMYTQHVDYMEPDHPWWNHPKRAAPMDCKPAYNTVGSESMEEEFMPYANPFEMQRSERIINKCAPRSDSWNYKVHRQLYRFRNLVPFNKIRKLLATK